MYFRHTLFVWFCLLAMAAHAQKNQDMDTKIASLPYYSFGKGLGITSPDSLYKLNIRFRMQNRITFSQNRAGQHSIDGQIRRLRLRLDGYVGKPQFSYALQLSFSAGDVGELNEGENLNIIRDAVFFYTPNKNWNIGFGQTKLPGNRQRVNSSGALQLTDRSINNTRFNIDRDFGLQVYYLNSSKNTFAFNIKTAISTGEGRNFTKNDDLGLAYTAKLELLPKGLFSNGGDYFEGDLMREPKPKFMFSAAYQFNDNAKKTQGQQGGIMQRKADLYSFLGDFVLKYRGYSFMAAYMARHSPAALQQGDKFIFAGQGFDLQSSYLNHKNYEFIGRYSNQKVDTRIHHLVPYTQQFSGGVTKYFWEHAFKLQSELTYQLEKPQNKAIGKSWYARFQVEIGI